MALIAGGGPGGGRFGYVPHQPVIFPHQFGYHPLPGDGGGLVPHQFVPPGSDFGLVPGPGGPGGAVLPLHPGLPIGRLGFHPGSSLTHAHAMAIAQAAVRAALRAHRAY
jgi:hypothetical protein